MKRLSSILIAFLLLLIQSCSTSIEINQQLDAAEKLMMQRPDSSLIILNKINADKISTNKDRARYALLITQARDKNFIDDTNPARISEAVKYYESTNNVRYKFLSLYYYGRILFNKGDYANAIIAYTRAEELITTLNDPYLAGLLYTQFGNIYRTYYDYNKCLVAFQNAYHYYAQSNSDTHMAYALLDIGIAYLNLKEPTLAEENFNNALQMAISLQDGNLQNICYQNLIALYDINGDVDRCGEIIEILNSQFDTAQLSSCTLGAMAGYYAKLNDYNRADSYLTLAWQKTVNRNDSLTLYFKQARVLETMGRVNEALHYIEKGTLLQHKQLLHTLQQPILTNQKEYFKNQAEYNSYRLKKNQQIFITLLASVLLLAVVIAMCVRHRILSKDLEIAKYMGLATDLQAAVQDRESRLSEIATHITTQEEIHNSMIDEMHHQVAELFHKQYDLLDKLSKTYYETHGCSKEKEHIYEQVKAEINKFSNDKRAMLQLEGIVNTYKQNVIQLIRDEIPSITERDIKLLCYIYAGFSAKSISIFVGETIGNVLTRKYRLRNKITKLNTPSLEIMLKEMP